jgi:hypothetical protein
MRPLLYTLSGIAVALGWAIARRRTDHRTFAALLSLGFSPGDAGMYIAFYATIAIALISTIWQVIASRTAARFQWVLIRSIWSMEDRTAILLVSVRRLLEEQERKRIIRDAREAQVRLAEREDAEAIIDIGRVHDGQAEQSRFEAERLASECAYRRPSRMSDPEEDPDGQSGGSSACSSMRTR